MSNTEIRPLTGLRGVVACWVVLFHANQEAGLHGPLGHAIQHGYLAVDLFFILSGFVMALSYRDFFRGGFTPPSYGAFLLRRIARVWPLYAVATLGFATLFAAGFGSGRISMSGLAVSLPLNLGMVQAWGLAPSIDHPAWSISTEFAAYLLFPAYAKVVLFSRPAIAAAVSLLAFMLLCLLPAMAGYSGLNGLLDLSEPGTGWPLLRCLLEFPLGLATYRFASACTPSSRLLSPASCWATIVFMLVLTTIPGSDLAVVLAAPLLLLQLAIGDRGVSRLFGSRPVLFLGHISYAIYLLHWLLLPLLSPIEHKLAGVLPASATPAAAQAILYVLLLPAATVAYRVVEVPGRRWVRRLARHAFRAESRAVASSEATGRAELQPSAAMDRMAAAMKD